MPKNIAVLSALTATLVAPTAVISTVPAQAAVTAESAAVNPAQAVGVNVGSLVTKTTKLVSPLKAGYRLTSKHGARCIPVIGGSTKHEGQDFGAANGSPIYAVADGIVKRTSNGTNSASGYIVVETNVGGKRHDMVYVHMWSATTHVRVGQKVKAGQQISLVGNSGPSTGPHLHFEIWDGAWYTTKSLDPIAFLKKHGLNLERNASYINRSATPSSCNYRINQFTNLKASASPSAKTLKGIAKNAIVTSKPGTLINGMVPVTANGTYGWVNRYSISPYSGPAPKAPAPVQQTSTVINKKTVAKGTYTATANVNLRAQAPSGAVLMTVPQGKEVTATGKTGADGNWYQVSYGKTSGWISGSYLKAKTVVAPVSSAKPAPVKPAPATSTSKNSSLKNKAMVTTGGLNLREKAVDGKVLASMPAGAKVTLTGDTAEKGTWVKAKYSSKTGWASLKYLKNAPAAAKAPAKTPAKTATVKTSTKYTTANLNLRKAPVDGAVIIAMPKGKAVTYTGKSAESGRWLQVKYSGKTGWASKTYLADKAPAKTTAKAPAKTTAKAPTAKKTTKTTKTALNMRSEANPSSRIVITLKQNLKVELIGTPTKNGWVKIKSGSKTGYVNGAYLK